MTDQELKHLRTKLAVDMCNIYPTLYFKVQAGLIHLCRTAEEATAYNLIVGLIEKEPSIRNILDFYQTEHKI